MIPDHLTSYIKPQPTLKNLYLLIIHAMCAENSCADIGGQLNLSEMSIGILALAIVLIPTGRWFWRAWKVDIPSSPYLFQMSWAAGLALGLLANQSGAESTAANWAIGLGSILLYLSFTGAQKVSKSAIRVGDKIPHFEGIDSDGKPFNSDTLENQRTIIKFFRAHW